MSLILKALIYILLVCGLLACGYVTPNIGKILDYVLNFAFGSELFSLRLCIGLKFGSFNALSQGVSVV